jgi:Uma2 family endonuclease
MVGALRSATVTRRRLTADEFERMVETGIIREDERVELVDGELIQMAAQGGPHVTCVMRLTHWFIPRLVERAIVSIQNAFRLSLHGEPQPDITLLRHREDFYGGVLPRAEDVLLIIEISDTTLRYDRDVKLPRYAAAGIPEVWIVDLQRRRVTTYRDPMSDGYRQVISHTRGAILSPLAFPDLELRWEDIFGQV